MTRTPKTMKPAMALPRSVRSGHHLFAIVVIKVSEVAMTFCVLLVLKETFNLRWEFPTRSNA